MHTKRSPTYFLSDPAYNRLRAYAVSCEFAGPHSAISHGIAAWLRACAADRAEWADERPSHVRASDTYALSRHLAPQWSAGHPAMPRQLGTLPLAYIVSTASSHGIRSLARQKPMVNGTLDRPRAYPPETTTMLVSAVLEAIGLGWLKPTTPLPHNAITGITHGIPHTTRKRRNSSLTPDNPGASIHLARAASPELESKEVLINGTESA